MKSLLVVFTFMLAGFSFAQPYAGKDVPEQLLAKSAGCSPPTTTTTMELSVCGKYSMPIGWKASQKTLMPTKADLDRWQKTELAMVVVISWQIFNCGNGGLIAGLS